jgi:acetyltransferase-like isoleucine patch superfamily enzyme
MALMDIAASGRRALLRTAHKRRFGAFGARSSFDPVTSRISGHENFHIGDDVFIGPYAVMSANGVRVSIGDDTVIGPQFCLMAGDHNFDLPGVPYRDAPLGRNEPIQIGRNVWIGARVTVLKGISIGDASVIGAGAVVTKDVPAFAVMTGTPARFLRWRFEGERRAEHERFLGSDDHARG